MSTFLVVVVILPQPLKFLEMMNDEDDSGSETLGCDNSSAYSVHPVTVNYFNIGHVETLNNQSQVDSEKEVTGNPVALRTSRGRVTKYIQRLWRDSIQDVPYTLREFLDVEDYTCILKKKLKKFYRDVTLPGVFWETDEDYMLSDHYVQLQLQSNSSTIHLEEVFGEVSGSRPTRILIEGEPGFGKTTLATKIAHDWATKEKYLRNYKLAFLLPLKELKGRSVITGIEAIAGHCGFNILHQVQVILQDNLNKTLLILDGLDKLPQENRAEVLRILFKQVYNEMTIVVTCKAGVFKVEPGDMIELFGGVSKKKRFHDKLINILGISVDHSEKFVRKFACRKKTDVVVKHLKKEVAFTRIMFKSPRELIITSLLTEEKEFKQRKLKPLLQMLKNSKTRPIHSC